MKYKLFRLLTRCHLMPKNILLTHQLDLGVDVAKRLDEYRELIEAIETQTGFFSAEDAWYSRHHAAAQDNYLSHLFTLRYADHASPPTVRPRPEVLSD